MTSKTSVPPELQRLPARLASPSGSGELIKPFVFADLKIWKYIEAHHEDLGVGLFILPCLVVTMAAAVLAFWLAQLLQ
jgi:hypothetical protein